MVKQYNKINKNLFNQLFVERDDLGSLTTIKYIEIVNIISCIRINEFRKEIFYLILNRTKIILEIYSMICGVISKFTDC
jgi:hypothetical protein